MFIRRKLVKGHWYYQLVEGYRDDAGRVRQRHIASLGQHATVREAITGALAHKRRLTRRVNDLAPHVALPWVEREHAKLSAQLAQQEQRLATLRTVEHGTRKVALDAADREEQAKEREAVINGTRE